MYDVVMLGRILHKISAIFSSRLLTIVSLAFEMLEVCVEQSSRRLLIAIEHICWDSSVCI